MKEIKELTDSELLTEYRQTIEYRTEERMLGQVSPKQIQLKNELEKEIIERMSE